MNGTISDPTYAVWVNGVQGINNGNGTWSADNVPTNPAARRATTSRLIPRTKRLPAIRAAVVVAAAVPAVVAVVVQAVVLAAATQPAQIQLM